MPARDPRAWMWSEACEFLDRADRLQRQFFQPGQVSRRPSWEPPLDVFENERELVIVAALPGVEPDQLEVLIQGTTLIVAGVRSLEPHARDGHIHRLEIPHGRFERRIELPSRRYQLGERSLAHGCLRLTLFKLS